MTETRALLSGLSNICAQLQKGPVEILSHFENGRNATAYLMLGLKRAHCCQVAAKFVRDYKRAPLKPLHASRDVLGTGAKFSRSFGLTTCGRPQLKLLLLLLFYDLGLRPISGPATESCSRMWLPRLMTSCPF